MPSYKERQAKERCLFKWGSVENPGIGCECIRRPSHEGNHFSYSGEEIENDRLVVPWDEHR
jgi:hypothetical protein